MQKTESKQSINSNSLLSKNSSLANKITTELVEPAYYNDAKDAIEGRVYWKKVSDYMETSAMILFGCGGLLSYAAGYFNLPYLGFISGSVTTVALVCLKFSSYAAKESKERTDQYNKISLEIGSMELTNIVIEQSDT